jgi:DNA-binding CsgD family transcriptional regulator
MVHASFEDTVSAIYGAAADPASWSNALEHVADYAGASGAMLAYQDLRRHEGFLLTGRLREDLGEIYLRDHIANPYTLAITRADRPVIANAIVDHATIRRTSLHADILAPQRIANLVIMPHAALTRRGAVGGVAITLDARQSDEADAALRRISELSPHLSRAIDLGLELARHQNDARRMGSLLHALPTAAFLLDHRGRLIEANALGEAALALGDGIRSESGFILAASTNAEKPRLRTLIHAAIAAGNGRSRLYQQAIQLQRPSRRAPYLAIATPLPRDAGPLWEALEPSARVLLQIIDPHVETMGRMQILCAAYGLTRAEARVAMLVAAGVSTPHAATRLGLAATTVRTHLKRCFEKTGIHSQAGLAALIAAIAVID